MSQKIKRVTDWYDGDLTPDKLKSMSKKDWSNVKLKTYPVDKKKYKSKQFERDMRNISRQIKQENKYKTAFNQLQIQMKTKRTVETLVKWLFRLGFKSKHIEAVFNQIYDDSKYFTKEKIEENFALSERQVKLILSKLMCEKRDPKKTGSQNPHISVSQKLLNRTGSRDLLLPGSSLLYGEYPPVPRSIQVALKFLDDENVQKYRTVFNRIFKLWFKIIFPSENFKKTIGSNPDYHQSQTFYIGLDCEWIMTLLKEKFKEPDEKLSKEDKQTFERELDNVLSFQIAGYSPDTKKSANAIVHNTTKRHFQFSELLRAIVDLCCKMSWVNDDGTNPKNMKIVLLTYYGMVDISVFAGWEQKIKKMLVIRKNYLVGRNFLTFKDVSSDNFASVETKNAKPENRFNVSFKLVDTGLLASSGGLTVLGDLIGMPKIDTTEFDKADGLDDGYYKKHMDEFRNNRPDDYNRYAMLDSIITLKYYLQCLQIFPDWATKPPATIGAYAASLVRSKINHDPKYSRQSIFDDNLTASEIADSVGSQGVKLGQSDLFNLSIKSYFGGFNTAFMSGKTHGNVTDTDLVSAYAVNGLLLSCPDFNRNDYTTYDDKDFSKLILNKPLTITESNDFSAIADGIKDVLEDNPFFIGFAKAYVKFPEDCQLITLPFHSTNKNFGPCYVREGETHASIIDLYNAYIHGAEIKLIFGKIPAQDFNSLNVFGSVQSEYISKRNDAKAKMKTAKEQGNIDDYNRYNATQSIFKLVTNSLYGKSGQGTSFTKRVRDFDTYESKSIGYCSITNPPIAATYTAFTRYLVTLLYDAVSDVYETLSPLNITTDGYTFCLPDGVEFDENAVRQAFLSKLPKYYFDRLAYNFNKVLGFELKGNVVDSVLNLKTRLNMTKNHNKNNGGINAMVSMHGQSVQEIFDCFEKNQISVENTQMGMSNATDMKHHVKNHYGHQEVWEMKRKINLQYDFAYKPKEYIETKDSRYFTTEPFQTVEEHDRYKQIGMILTKKFPIMVNKSCFSAFVKTMNQTKFSVRLKDIDETNDFNRYCFKHWASLKGLSVNDLNPLAQKFDVKIDTLRRFIKGHTPDKENVNYLASWYFENYLL